MHCHDEIIEFAIAGQPGRNSSGDELGSALQTIELMLADMGTKALPDGQFVFRLM